MALGRRSKGWPGQSGPPGQRAPEAPGRAPGPVELTLLFAPGTQASGSGTQTDERLRFFHPPESHWHGKRSQDICAKAPAVCHPNFRAPTFVRYVTMTRMIYDITPPITDALEVWPGDTPPSREV